MAISSSSLSLSSSRLLQLCNSTSISSKPKLPTTFLFLSNVSKQQQQMQLPSYKLSTTRVFVARQLLDSTVAPQVPDDKSPDFYDPAVSEVGGLQVPELNQLGQKLIIRVKLKSYWVPLIEDSCKKILDVARNTNAKVSGPIPLPTKKRIYCASKSPHVHKDVRLNFEIRTHFRVIDILYPTANTIDALGQLDIPAGVDVQLSY